MGRRNVFIAPALILLLAPVLSINAQTARENPGQNAKLKAAEAAADLIAARFHRDLDFKGIFADEFVTEPRLRARTLSLDDDEKWKQFDVATRERVYVTTMTFLHLWAEYMMVQKQHDVPPEIEQLPEPKLFSHSPQTMAQVDDGISELQQMSAMYRKYFPPGVFAGAQYRQSVSDGVAFANAHAHNVPRVESGNAKFGVPESVSVYIVRPEAFDYYFVEEKGKMKLFYVNILPNFRLF
ncbi:MAG TPA: hypothetical protein VE961_25755 [Pyrinomonadaceae bacterium]|nr:hypothetical protein [Pyrinomonadaceae bacterium]